MISRHGASLHYPRIKQINQSDPHRLELPFDGQQIVFDRVEYGVFNHLWYFAAKLLMQFGPSFTPPSIQSSGGANQLVNASRIHGLTMPLYGIQVKN